MLQGHNEGRENNTALSKKQHEYKGGKQSIIQILHLVCYLSSQN